MRPKFWNSSKRCRYGPSISSARAGVCTEKMKCVWLKRISIVSRNGNPHRYSIKDIPVPIGDLTLSNVLKDTRRWLLITAYRTWHQRYAAAQSDSTSPRPTSTMLRRMNTAFRYRTRMDCSFPHITALTSWCYSSPLPSSPLPSLKRSRIFKKSCSMPPSQLQW